MRETPRLDDAGAMPASILAYQIMTLPSGSPPMAMPEGTVHWTQERLVALGLASAELKDGQWCFSIGAKIADSPQDEIALLRAVEESMADTQVIASFGGHWNAAPALLLAAQRHRLWDMPALAAHAAAKPGDPALFDLADIYGNMGGPIGLPMLCSVLGLGLCTGSDDAGVDDGNADTDPDIDPLDLYPPVMSDPRFDRMRAEAVATLILAMSWYALRAGDEGLIARPLAALARQIEANQWLAGLRSLVDSSLMGWARPRAMKADVAAALGRVLARLTDAEKKRGRIVID